MKLRKMISYAMLLLLCVCAALAEDVPSAEGEAVVYRDQELVEYPEDKTDASYAVPEGVTRVNVTPFWNLHLWRLSMKENGAVKSKHAARCLSARKHCGVILIGIRVSGRGGGYSPRIHPQQPREENSRRHMAR